MVAGVGSTTHHAAAMPAFFAVLNPLDWALLLLVSASAFLAFLRGLIRSVISLAGVVAGILLAAWYGATLARWLTQWIHPATVASVIAFLGIVAASYLTAALLGRVLRSACQAVGLGIFDRLGGALFGATRAVLLIAAVMVPAAPFLPLLPFARDSVLLPYLRTAAHGISFVMPRDIGERLSAGAESLYVPATRHPMQSLTKPSSSTAPRTTAEGETQ